MKTAWGALLFSFAAGCSPEGTEVLGRARQADTSPPTLSPETPISELELLPDGAAGGTLAVRGDGYFIASHLIDFSSVIGTQLTALGKALQPTGVLLSTSGGDTTYPGAACAEDGTCVVAWGGDLAPPLRIAKIAPDGSVTARASVNDAVYGGPQHTVDVQRCGDRYLIAWGLGSSIHFGHFDDDLAPLEPEPVEIPGPIFFTKVRAACRGGVEMLAWGGSAPVQGVVNDENGLGDVFEVEPEYMLDDVGLAAADGQFLVTYATNEGAWARRVSASGTLIDTDPLELPLIRSGAPAFDGIDYVIPGAVDGPKWTGAVVRLSPEGVFRADDPSVLGFDASELTGAACRGPDDCVFEAYAQAAVHLDAAGHLDDAYERIHWRGRQQLNPSVSWDGTRYWVAFIEEAAGGKWDQKVAFLNADGEHEGPLETFASAPVSWTAVASFDDRTLLIWRTETSSKAQVFTGAGNPVAPAFSLKLGSDAIPAAGPKGFAVAYSNGITFLDRKGEVLKEVHDWCCVDGPGLSRAGEDWVVVHGTTLSKYSYDGIALGGSIEVPGCYFGRCNVACSDDACLLLNETSPQGGGVFGLSPLALSFEVQLPETGTRFFPLFDGTYWAAAHRDESDALRVSRFDSVGVATPSLAEATDADFVLSVTAAAGANNRALIAEHANFSGPRANRVVTHLATIAESPVGTGGGGAGAGGEGGASGQTTSSGAAGAGGSPEHASSSSSGTGATGGTPHPSSSSAGTGGAGGGGAAPSDAGNHGASFGGCGCRMDPSSATSPLLVLAAILGIGRRNRRARRE